MSEDIPVRKAELARLFGVDRVRIIQLSREPEFPKAVQPDHWNVVDVRDFLRARARRGSHRRAGTSTARYCATCGGEL